MKKVLVHAPATIANLVCGFDILGLCLEEPYDVMEIELLDRPELIIETSNGFALPADPAQNTAGAPLLEMMKELTSVGFHVRIEKRIKPGSGLGSSAASAAGAVAGANALLNNHFDQDDLVRFAMTGEKVASGVKHADNVTPCLRGGVTLIRSIFPLDIISLPAPDLFVSVVHPQIEVRTADARQILRKEVQLKDAIRQWGNIAGLVAGLVQSNYELISRSLEDVIIEPVRSILIPGFDGVKRRCRMAGALGGGISGSGPSMFMLSRDAKTAAGVVEIMREVYEGLGIEHYCYNTLMNTNGCKLIYSNS